MPVHALITANYQSQLQLGRGEIISTNLSPKIGNHLSRSSSIERKKIKKTMTLRRNLPEADLWQSLSNLQPF